MCFSICITFRKLLCAMLKQYIQRYCWLWTTVALQRKA